MIREDKDFNVKNSLNCRGRLVDLSTPAIMGILNLSPDSFYDGGRHLSKQEYISKTENMLEEGALIIDVGAQSTRPGAAHISESDEWSRLEKPLKDLLSEFPETVFSIDTFYAGIAQKAADLGVSIINDVSAGNADIEMFPMLAKLKLPYILMHMQGTPLTMQINPVYKDVVLDVIDFFNTKIIQLQEIGVHDLIVDPGFGFGKTIDQNYRLLKLLNYFSILKFPLMAGLSRKSMVTRVLGNTPHESLNGTSVLNTLALMNGAKILRVHDVKEAKEAILIVEKLKSV